MRTTRRSAEFGASPVEWETDGRASPVMAVAVHAGHALRPEAAELAALTDEQRLLEEDPGTDVLARVASLRGIAVRSRFEVDLNRAHAHAVYSEPDDAWGLDLWKEPPSEDFIRRSLALHDRFYRQLTAKVSETIRAHGVCVVLDIHSYNHMRDGSPEDPSGTPEVNVGTGSMDTDRWGFVVDSLMEDLAMHDLDVRENVRFRGREVARFIHRRFPHSACCPALDLKKTYMDETTGTIDRERLEHLRQALSSTLPGLEEILHRVADRAS